MSYILDALRRAQADRERGQVPGLHAQPGLGGLPRASAPAARPAWQGPLLGASLMLLLALPLVWWLSRPAQPPAVVSSAPTAFINGAAVNGAAATAPSPAPGTAAAPPAGPGLAGADGVQPLVVVSALPPPPKSAARPSPKPAPTPVAAAAVAPNPAATAAASPLPPGASPGGPPPLAGARAPVTPAAAPAPVATAALPPPLSAEQRRSWPAFSLGGSVWSETASARFVILGGQVVHEGESTPDGVFVERITPKAAVLRWRDQRASLLF